MYSNPNYNKDNQLISYRLIASGKDPYSGRHKNYTRTWKIPTHLKTKKEIEHALSKAKYEFEEEVQKLSMGVCTIENNVLFGDFAKQWLENILIRNNDSFSHYNCAKQHLQVILPFFKDCQLKNIGPNLIQTFYDQLSASTYEKQVIVVKKSIKELFVDKKLNQQKMSEDIGINRLTLRLASNIGNKVSSATAKAICDYFNVPMSKYFETTVETKKYSRATMLGIRTTLVMILSEAKRRMLIEHNYATKEYTRGVSGSVKKITVLSEDEARRLVKCLINEKDLRIKTAISIFLFLGLRKGEVAGLCFDDINFENNTISINRNCIYAGKEFGIKIKSPKTKSSKRTICVPTLLMDILKEYSIWWNEQKILHGDLWENSKFLFLQDNGQVINPCTLAQWVTKFEIKNGFEHIPCHWLRHSATSLMLNSGVPLKVVSKILGHSSEAFTLQIYTHILDGQEEQASKTYNNYLTAE